MPQAIAEPTFYSVGAAAEIAGVETWRVQRLFSDGTLKEPARFAGKRAIPAAMIPAIIDALRSRGWLPEAVEQAADTSSPVPVQS